MDASEWLQCLFALLFGALALQPRAALRILSRGQPPDDAEEFVLGLRLIGYVGLLVVVVSWIVDHFLVS